MHKKIYIYAPNISKDNLISLLYLQLSEAGDRLELELIRQERKRFRAPEICASLKDVTGDLVAIFVARLVETARGLGGTQLVFKDSHDKAVIQSPTHLTNCQLIDLSESKLQQAIEKIEIY